MNKCNINAPLLSAVPLAAGVLGSAAFLAACTGCWCPRDGRQIHERTGRTESTATNRVQCCEGSHQASNPAAAADLPAPSATAYVKVNGLRLVRCANPLAAYRLSLSANNVSNYVDRNWSDFWPHGHANQDLFPPPFELSVVVPLREVSDLSVSLACTQVAGARVSESRSGPELFLSNLELSRIIAAAHTIDGKFTAIIYTDDLLRLTSADEPSDGTFDMAGSILIEISGKRERR